MTETINPSEPVAKTLPITIRDASEAWLFHLETRRQKPAKKSSLTTLRSYVSNHIEHVAHQDISTFGNGSMRAFVDHLVEKKLSPKMIHEIVACVKSIIASVTDAEGEPLYAKTWRAKFIDCPLIGKQHQPKISSAQIESAIQNSPDPHKILWALLAGSGIRIGEARSLRIGDDGTHSSWDYTQACLRIRTSMWRGFEGNTKTAAGVRTVEIPYALNDFILANLWLDPKFGGFLFANQNGGPAHENTLRKSLARLDLGDISFHSFRRFFTTHRREEVPEEILKAWLGHSIGSDTTLRYSKLAEDANERRRYCESVGLGFNLPQAAQPVKPEIIQEVEPEFAEATL